MKFILSSRVSKRTPAEIKRIKEKADLNSVRLFEKQGACEGYLHDFVAFSAPDINDPRFKNRLQIFNICRFGEDVYICESCEELPLKHK